MDETNESQRPKRRRLDKSGRIAALEKMRNLKGKKNKYNVDPMENIYDIVDEEEYAKRVNQQASEQWIDEDEVGGYVEDGREIFDEFEEVEVKDSKAKSTVEKKSKETKTDVAQTHKLTKYFVKDHSQIQKRKHINIGGDALLFDVLNDIDKNTSADNMNQEKHQEDKITKKTIAEDDVAHDHIITKDNIECIKSVVSNEISKVEDANISNEFTQDWSEATKNVKENEEVQSCNDINLQNINTLTMWLWDVWEDNYKKPGHLFLFGRAEINGTFTSVCVQITNVEHCLYLLPRAKHLTTQKDIVMADVYNEFTDSIAPSLGIDEHKCKQVTKNFAFQIPDVDVPQTCDYLMVRYSGDKKVPDCKANFKTISYIFGCNTSSTERFLIEKNIKGPCWITLSNYSVVDVSSSYCKLQLTCSDISCISVIKEKTDVPPPLVVMSVNLRVIMNKQSKNEIVAISCLVNKDYCIDNDASSEIFTEHYCLVSHSSDKAYPFGFINAAKDSQITKIQICDSERGLLNCFLAKVQSLDPDLIVTQDAYARQLDVLCASLVNLKIPLVSRIGRLKLSNVSAYRKVEEYFIGRMIADIKSSAEELLRLRSYDMNSLCKEILKIPDGKRKEIYADEIPSMFDKTETLLELIHLTMQDNLYSLRIMCELQILPLALQITNISGNTMSGTLRGGRSERNEWLLLHAFAEKNYLVPEKQQKEKKKLDGSETVIHKKKAQYTGGLVLDPMKGFYDKFVLLMDFNSLYPSIIQEYNICFTTINVDENGVALPSSSTESGILPKQIKQLVESRRHVKALLAQSDLSKDAKMKYNIRQKALKLTANSMYGCLGFSHSRFYAQHIASLITQKGRDILLNTKTIVEKLQYVVVYGDTDSIMVLTNSTNYEDVYEKGINIKQTVNKAYRHVELDIDGIYKYLLLLKKKKYAAVAISKKPNGEIVETVEYKGLDIIRRDWCKFAQQVGEKVLGEILSDKPMENRISNIHNDLVKVKHTMFEGQVDHTLLEITKQLSQSIGEYRDSIQNLPHVQVAMRMNTTMNRNFKKGDVVGYVICDDGTEEPYIKRAYHLDEMKINKKLKIDKNYYLANQVHPIIARIIEPLNEIDSARIAECLGLDPKKYRSNARPIYDDRDDNNSLQKPNTERFRFCSKFVFTCQICKKPNAVPEALRIEQNKKISVFEKCMNTDCKANPTKFGQTIINELILGIKGHIQRFYDNWLVCDDPLCSNNSNLSTHVTEKGKPTCNNCKKGALVRQFSEKELFNQLDYYKHTLNLNEKDLNCSDVPPDTQELHKELVKITDKFINLSSFVRVNQKDMFRYYSTKNKVHVMKSIEWNTLIEKDV